MTDRPAALQVRGEVARFLPVGVIAVAIDFVIYRLMLHVPLPVPYAKTISFVTGALFAYVANRSFTFRIDAKWRQQELPRFATVYAVGLLANVGTNSAVLFLLGRREIAILAAFVMATGVSATLNFLGMKLFVFAGDSEKGRQTMPVAGPRAHASGAAPRLSLVIPCYNEAKNLPLLVARLREVFTDDGAEVVLVDNGSTDDSPEVMRELLDGQSRIRSVRVEKNQGYGFGILSGLRAARGDVLAWTHADMQTDPLDALKGLALFDEAGNAPLFVKGERYGRPAADVVFTVGMSIFETVLLRRSLWDINAQPTMFRREFFDTWQDPPHDFALDLYAYYQAVRRGLTVKRFPVHFGQRAHGTSHWNVNWRAKARFIKRTVDFSLRLRQNLERPA